MKILTIIGARPQFIKASVLSRLISKDKDVEEIMVHTGQHYEANMSDIFFREMDISSPKYNLAIQSQFHGEMTGLMMAGIEKIAIAEAPDGMLVYGDTNSTLSGALVAAKLNIKLAHVEAGLRSYNNKMPEEINRIITDRLSTLLFCPSENAVINLNKEGFALFNDKRIVLSGDIMYDASLYYSSQHTDQDKNFTGDFILCTIHRAENTDDADKLLTIFKTLNILGSKQKVIVPLHPRTKNKLAALYSNYQEFFSHILFVPPLGYFDMISHLRNCKLVITDSGGLQKEAFFFKKMCLTLRDETEWTELTSGGYNILSQISETEIISKAEHILATQIQFDKELYGKGKAGETILEEIKNYQR